MCHDDPIDRKVKAAQGNVFRRAEFEFNISQANVSEQTGIHKNSVSNYSLEHQTMGLANFWRLFFVFPTRLLSALIPEGFYIVRVPDCLDYDDIDRVVKAEEAHRMATLARETAEQSTEETVTRLTLRR